MHRVSGGTSEAFQPPDAQGGKAVAGTAGLFSVWNSLMC